MTRALLGCLVALTLVACGGSSATPAPARTAGPDGGGGQATSAPAQATPPAGASTPAPGGGGGGGSPEAIVKALVPPGSTEVTHMTIGNLYSATVTSQMSLADLEAFFDQKLPTTGVTQSGKLNQAGSLIYAFTNPDGGITAADDGNGSVQITISAGTSS